MLYVTDNMSSDESMKELGAGNGRFVSGIGASLKKHGAGQSPKAIVLTCSDSRVVPEKIFDQGIGDLFVVRVAGNVAYEASVIQSIEYAVTHLDVKLIIILGHTKCGAVKAAEESGEGAEGILKEIRLSFMGHENHILANLYRQVEMLPERSRIIKKAMEEAGLKIQPAMYDIETGRVEFQ